MENLIIQKLKEIVQEQNKTPTSLEFYRISGYSKRTVINYFETYNKLLDKANIKPLRVVEKFVINCKQCNIELLRPSYKLNSNNFCSQSCASTFNNSNSRPRPKKDRESCCDNCQKTFYKTKDKVSNTCSQFCLMELGMKQRIMKNSIKRKRS